MKQEFDQYIDNYRTNCDKALRLSGETSAFFAEYKAQKLAEWFPAQISLPINILDFGCGDGVMTNFVQNSFPKAQVYGVDPSPKSLTEAKKRFDRISFSLSSEEPKKLHFESHFFDLIFSAGVFHHIPFHHHEAYLDHLVETLKPNGYFILFELNPLNPLTVFTFRRNPIDQNAKMLSPWYSHRLAKKYGKLATKFYCFYPKLLSWLRPTESYMTKIPFGALYATIIQKQEKACKS